MKYEKKKFKNTAYLCSHYFEINKLLIRCECFNFDEKRNAILEVINSANGELIGMYV